MWVRTVKKLYEGKLVSIKDYEWDKIKDSRFPLRITLVDLINNAFGDMTLSPSQVLEGRYSKGNYFEDYPPYNKGFFINFYWIPDKKPEQLSFDIMSTLAAIKNSQKKNDQGQA